MTLNEHLAINVMGWHESKNAELQYRYWADGYNSDDMWKDNWNPTTNIEQAMACLDTFVWWNLSKDEITGDFSCEVAIDNEFQTLEISKSRTMAISLACARATGFTL